MNIAGGYYNAIVAGAPTHLSTCMKGPIKRHFIHSHVFSQVCGRCHGTLEYVGYVLEDGTVSPPPSCLSRMDPHPRPEIETRNFNIFIMLLPPSTTYL